MNEPQAAFDPRVLPWTALWRVLFMRATADEVRAFGGRELAVGAAACWIVGIGRWWDDPTAQLVQKLGLGSVAYPFVLGALLWLLFWPWRLPHWRYKALAAYIALCAAPGLLYVVPVEMFLSTEGALAYNSVALSIVASWRVVLLHRYFRVAAGLSGLSALVATLLPVAAIVMGMTMLNVSSGVIEGMGGFRGDPKDAFAAQIGIMASVLLIWPFFGGALYYLGYTIKVWVWPEPKG
ncbi:MAG: hypothetical protein AAB320_00400 [Elusimicrobiota bacterium]